jgi:hypothetical protein
MWVATLRTPDPDRGDVDPDEVRLGRIHVHGQPGGREPSGETLRTRVILGQPLDVVIDRIEHPGGHDPGLPERPAEQELQPPRFLDPLGRAREDRAHRAAEPF